MAVQTHQRGQLSRKRINLVFGLILIIYLLLVARLVVLQIRDGQGLHAEATHNRRQSIVIPAQRGSICDRDGQPLAVSLYSGTVVFDPKAAVASNNPGDTARLAKSVAAGIHALAPMIGMTEAELQSAVSAASAHYGVTRSRCVIVKKNISVSIAQQIRQIRPPIVGFGVVDGSRRYYTSGDNAAQVVGFVSSDGFGKAGLERSCSHWLTGAAGLEVAEMDQRHREIPDTRLKASLAHDGYDVHTTLDASAQHVATEAGKEIMNLYHPLGVSIVIVDPITGDLLALVSMPNYDPNPGQNKTITAMSQWERCATTLYEPGSTLKALTLAAALDDGTISTSNRFYCSGELQIGKKIIHCAHGEVHGSCNASEILSQSCNIGAAQVGMKMGPRRLFDADRRFGLFENYGIGLPGEHGGRLSFDNRENIFSLAKCARVAFGQSITTTPLHVAMAYSALVNGGILMQPRLVTSITDVTGRDVRLWETKPIRRVISQNTSRELCGMLRGVVEDGTAKTAAIPGYRIGGKTGTAQKYHEGKYVGSFVGYLPASPNVKPRAVILVAVDEPQGKHYGADVAAPAFKSIAGKLMSIWHVQEDDPNGLQAKIAAQNLKLGSHITLTASLDRQHD